MKEKMSGWFERPGRNPGPRKQPESNGQQELPFGEKLGRRFAKQRGIESEKWKNLLPKSGVAKVLFGAAAYGLGLFVGYRHTLEEYAGDVLMQVGRKSLRDGVKGIKRNIKDKHT